MPYIDSTLRESLLVRDIPPLFGGELNFLITDECLNFIASRGACYSTFNEVIGALECAKLEMYRRMVAPYEDNKKEENGDVYP